MKCNFFFLLCFLCLLNVRAQQTAIVSDVKITYQLSGSDSQKNNALEEAKKVVLIKGKMVRVDLSSLNYKQSIINTGKKRVLLKEIGNEKYMIHLTSEEWEKENKKFENSIINFTAERKNILGYNCKNATITLKDGTKYNVYYSAEINTAVPENRYHFGQIPGLVLKYEITIPNKQRISYTAMDISFNIIPRSNFDIPTSGYRILTNPEFF